LNKLKEAHKNQDYDGLDKAMEEMNTAWSAASEEIYKAGQEGGAPGAEQQHNEGANANANGDQVTDADYEEVK
jgi:molecular chaperone DnaK